MAAEASQRLPSLPYHEPAIITILIQSSFLLLLNAINAVLDHLVYCGLLGQVLIGTAWGTPGAKWLSTEVENVAVQLGYLGLILLIYEGTLHLILLRSHGMIYDTGSPISAVSAQAAPQYDAYRYCRRAKR